MPDFTYRTTDCRRQVQPRVAVVQFGDGYEQRAGLGINTRLGKYAVTFAGLTKEEGDAIEAFLEAKAGYLSFTWVPPGKAEASFVARAWERTWDPNGESISTIVTLFEEVPL